jgi:RNA polymerase sigma factor (sigma-70 family)
MKKYNLQNYLRYKDDLKKTIKRIDTKDYSEHSRDELIALFLPLVENIAKKFSTADQASGVMDITDIIQEGSIGLIYSVDNINWDKIKESNNQEQTIKSFLSKRIKGSIRRAIDINRGSIRIPEHKLNEIRKGSDQDHKLLHLFFSSMVGSLDRFFDNSNATDYDLEAEYTEAQFEDKSEEYNIDILNAFILSLFKKHLTVIESEVLRLSYGLDCDKHSANAISEVLGFKGPSAYVRVSELKKFAISKLITKCDPKQLFEYV